MGTTVRQGITLLREHIEEEAAMEEEAEVEVASLLEEDIHIAEVEEVPLADLSVEEGADSPYYLNKGIKKIGFPLRTFQEICSSPQ